MLTTEEMVMADALYDRASKALLITGHVRQAFIAVRDTEALFLPVNVDVNLSTSIALELLIELGQMEDADIVAFISQASMIKLDIPKNEMPEDKEEAYKLVQSLKEANKDSAQECLMMMVLHTKSKELYTKVGSVLKDSDGGHYVKDAEWLEEVGVPSHIHASLSNTRGLI